MRTLKDSVFIRLSRLSRLQMKMGRAGMILTRHPYLGMVGQREPDVD